MIEANRHINNENKSKLKNYNNTMTLSIECLFVAKKLKLI